MSRRKAYYLTCPDCGAHLDPGETCSCNGSWHLEPKDFGDEPISSKLKVSESLIIGVDISAGQDISMLQVGRHNNGIVTIINTLVGKEAEDMYAQLTSAGSHTQL